MSSDWGERIVEVVDGWLFTEPGALPSTLVVPLENPHLHDPSTWAGVIGSPSGTNGVVGRHLIDGREIGVAKPVLGATATAMLVDAAARRGVRAVVGIGFCGGTDPTLRCGDLIVASAAGGSDGVSQEYDPASSVTAADPDLLALARDRALVGPVRSVAAVHLEDQALVDECARDGVLGVDLETTALYTVSKVRGVAAVAVLTVSDVPATGAAADGPALVKGLVRAVELGVSVATRAAGSAP